MLTGTWQNRLFVVALYSSNFWCTFLWLSVSASTGVPFGTYAINLRGFKVQGQSFTVEYRTSKIHSFKLYGKIPNAVRSFVLILPYAKYEFRVNATWLGHPWTQLQKHQATIFQTTVRPGGEIGHKTSMPAQTQAHTTHTRTQTHTHINKFPLDLILFSSSLGKLQPENAVQYNHAEKDLAEVA